MPSLPGWVVLGTGLAMVATREGAERSFQKKSARLCKQYEQHRLHQAEEHERILLEFLGDEDRVRSLVVQHACEVRAKTSLPTQQRDWSQPDDTVQRWQEVEQGSIRQPDVSRQVETQVMSTYRAFLHNMATDTTGRYMAQANKKEEARLISTIKGFYQRLHYEAEARFRDLIDFFEAASQLRRHQAVGPLIQDMVAASSRSILPLQNSEAMRVLVNTA